MTAPQVLDSVLSPAGPIAARSTEIGWVLIGGAAAVFGIVLALLLWVLLRPRPDRGHAIGRRRAAGWIFGGGLVFPLVVLGALLAYDLARSAALSPPSGGTAIVISVKGHLWWWEVRYRDPGSGGDVVVANEIRLPVGRALTAGLLSDDVIHSLWVPALGGKVDLVPGRINQMTLWADRPGVFRGECAEFCGEQHARMGLPVIAQPADAFDRWLAGQAQPATQPRDAVARRGMQVFTEQRCPACHAVRGLVDDGIGIGPDLTHLASRQRLAATPLPLTAQSLARWIGDPQTVKPGARMPSYRHLDESSMQALVAFLMQLT